MDPQGCFHPLSILNDAAINMNVQIHFWDFVFNSFRDIDKREIVDSCDHSVSNYLRMTILFSILVITFYIPTNNAQGFQIFHILPNILLCDIAIATKIVGMSWYLVAFIFSYFNYLYLFCWIGGVLHIPDINSLTSTWFVNISPLL